MAVWLGQHKATLNVTFLRYFLLYFVLAFAFRVALAVFTSKLPANEALAHAISDPNLFLYTVILAGAVAIFSLRRARPQQGDRRDAPD